MGNCHCTRSCTENAVPPTHNTVFLSGLWRLLSSGTEESKFSSSVWGPALGFLCSFHPCRAGGIPCRELGCSSWSAPLCSPSPHTPGSALPAQSVHWRLCQDTWSFLVPGSVIHVGLHCPYKQPLLTAVKGLLKNEVLTKTNCECWRKNLWCGSESCDSQAP